MPPSRQPHTTCGAVEVVVVLLLCVCVCVCVQIHRQTQITVGVVTVVHVFPSLLVSMKYEVTYWSHSRGLPQPHGSR
jgi:hypothetical protein